MAFVSWWLLVVVVVVYIGVGIFLVFFLSRTISEKKKNYMTRAILKGLLPENYDGTKRVTYARLIAQAPYI